MRYSAMLCSAAVLMSGALGGCALFTGVSPASGPVVNRLTSPAGQLFCKFDAADGDKIVGVIDLALSAANLGAASPVAVLATGAGAAMVAHECDLAAAAAGVASAVPVPPPPVAVPEVAIFVPAGAPTSAAPAAGPPAS